MYEEIKEFEELYKDAQAWVSSERAAFLKKVGKSKELEELERSIAALTESFTQRLTAPGYDLMLTEGFSEASFKQQMGVVRFKLSQAAAVGYKTVSELQQAVMLEKNRQLGLVKLPKVLSISQERLNSSVGYTAKLLSERGVEEAARGYKASQSSIVKHAQLETVIFSGSELLEGKRITTGAETCDYCKGLADWWTAELGRLRHFHSDCDCILITRPL